MSRLPRRSKGGTTLAKGQARSNREKRKPKADANKKSGGLAPSRPEQAPPRSGKEPSEMYKLFAKDRSVG
jgi:hypothetical protein